MTATAEPSAPVEAPVGALDRAEGVELLGPVHGSGYKDGAALVRRGDGQMVQLGPLMYALLECVDGRRDTDALADRLSAQVGRRFEQLHVVRLAEKLAAQGLLAGSEHQAPPRRNPLLALRWKVLVTNPAVTQRLTAPFTVLFRPWLMAPILAAFVAVCWFVLVEKGVASATRQAFDNPELLLLVFVLAIASAGFHELGHASACRYGGATPGGMGMGLYIVWPAFYTDVTDAYRLPRRDRLRVDLGGLYFNAVVSVSTMAVWLAWRADALLLLIALQLLQMVKQLSPVIRADGYHILSDATGIPDLYAHIGPTLRRLLPGRRREPSALKGRARLLVTLWVLVVVPVLASLALGAILLLPRLVTTAWDSGRTIGAAVPHDAATGDVVGLLTALVRLVALVLPVLGTFLMAHKVARDFGGRAIGWSRGRPERQVFLAAAAAAAVCGAAWAWWPQGQYRPIRAQDGGTLISLVSAVSAPAAAAHPVAAAAPVTLTPGRHLAVAMIPVGGATKRHPALFLIRGGKGQAPVALLSDSTPAPADAGAPTTTETVETTTTTEATTTDAAATTTDSAPAAPAAVTAVAFPFKLPAAPGPGGTQALAVGTKDGAVTYDVAYALVTVKDGAPVTNTNSAFALASCRACTTVAVSFQVVLIVGRSNAIAPINAAGALNVNCPACVTLAIADQIVVTLKSQPSQALVDRLTAALQRLNAVSTLGGSPAAIAAEVVAVQQEIETELKDSGLLANPPAATTTGTSTGTGTATTTAPATTTSATTAATTTAPATTTTAAAATTTATTTTSATTTATTTTATATTGAATTTSRATTTNATTTTDTTPATTTSATTP